MSQFVIASQLDEDFNEVIRQRLSQTHPESRVIGVPAGVPSDLPARIAANLYPYARGKPHPRMLPSPVSGHEMFPPALRDMFDRAFSAQARRRPSAQEWATLLLDYARRNAGQLVACGKDAAHQHFVGMPCAACARVELLAGSARAAQTRSRQKPAKARKQRARTAARVAQAQPVGAQASAASGVPGVMSRVTMAVIGTLLLGWVMGWGMPAYRRYSALDAQVASLTALNNYVSQQVTTWNNANK